MTADDAVGEGWQTTQQPTIDRSVGDAVTSAEAVAIVTAATAATTTKVIGAGGNGDRRRPRCLLLWTRITTSCGDGGCPPDRDMGRQPMTSGGRTRGGGRRHPCSSRLGAGAGNIDKGGGEGGFDGGGGEGDRGSIGRGGGEGEGEGEGESKGEGKCKGVDWWWQGRGCWRWHWQHGDGGGNTSEAAWQQGGGGGQRGSRAAAIARRWHWQR